MVDLDLSKGVVERESDLKLSDSSPLVRQRIADLVGEVQSNRAGQGAHGVILDVEVDGVRCLLLWVPEERVPLSPREREIARMVAKGYPNKTIAAILAISSWTVASHLRRVFSKLRVSTRAAMVAKLLEDGQMMDREESIEAWPPVAQPSPTTHHAWPTRLVT
jgi:DNA-binding CsgD family transcriptional regulator